MPGHRKQHGIRLRLEKGANLSPARREGFAPRASLVVRSTCGKSDAACAADLSAPSRMAAILALCSFSALIGRRQRLPGPMSTVVVVVVGDGRANLVRVDSHTLPEYLPATKSHTSGCSQASTPSRSPRQMILPPLR